MCVQWEPDMCCLFSSGHVMFSYILVISKFADQKIKTMAIKSSNVAALSWQSLDKKNKPMRQNSPVIISSHPRLLLFIVMLHVIL